MVTSILSSIVLYGAESIVIFAFGLVTITVLIASVIVATLIKKVANARRRGIPESHRAIIRQINKKLWWYEIVIRSIVIVAMLVALVVVWVVNADNVVWLFLPCGVMLVVSWGYELAKSHYINNKILSNIN